VPTQWVDIIDGLLLVSAVVLAVRNGAIILAPKRPR